MVRTSIALGAALLVLIADVSMQGADTPLQVWAKSLAQAARLAASGDSKGAEKAYLAAVRAGEDLTAQPERLGMALNNLGGFYFRGGRLDDAERTLLRAVQTLEAGPGPTADQTLDARFNLGSLYFKADKMAKAREEFESIAERRRDGSGQQLARLAKTYVYLAQIHQFDGANDRAHSYYMGALGILDKDREANRREFDMAFGMAAAMLDEKIRFLRVRRDDNSLRATLIFLDRARDLHSTFGDGVLGENLARQSIEARRQLMGDKSPAAWRGLLYLARALTTQQRFDEATATLEEALDLIQAEKDLGPLAESPVLREMAAIAAKKGDSAAVEKVYWRLIELRREVFGAEHGGLQQRYDAAIEALRALGDDAAAQRFEKAKAESPPGPWESLGENDAGAVKAKLCKSIPPEYPTAARQRAYEATVRLEVLIDESGELAEAHVLECAGHGLDQAAMNAVKKWRYEPGRIQGVPTPMTAQIDVNFILRTER